MSVRFTISLTLQDYIAANVLYQKRYWLSGGLPKIFGVSAAMVFLVSGLSAMDQPITSGWVLAQVGTSLCLGLAIIVIIPIVSLITMRLSVKRTFAQLSLDLPVSYEINETAVRAANAKGTSNLEWGDFADFVQDGRLLLLRRTRRHFFPLPKAQLSPEQLDGVLALLRQRGVMQG